MRQKSDTHNPSQSQSITSISLPVTAHELRITLSCDRYLRWVVTKLKHKRITTEDDAIFTLCDHVNNTKKVVHK